MMEKLGTDNIIEINGQSITVYDSPHTTDNMVYAVQINNKTIIPILMVTI